MKTRSIITFATNKRSYYKFAINCAKSILLHNDLPIYIVTNLDVKVPKYLRSKVFILNADSSHAKLGIGIKLFIDKYLQTEETIFIDSDCICFANLSIIFESCQNKALSVVGNIVNAEAFCGKEQAKVIKENFNTSKLVKFNGGLYYINRSNLTTDIFNLSRSIIPNYDRFGFNRINNKWINEEGLISIAMMKFNQIPISDDGKYMTDLYTNPHPYGLNVLKGNSSLFNPPSYHLRHRNWYPPGLYHPIILHFGGNALNSFPYIKQKILLDLKSIGLSVFISSVIANFFFEFPFKFYYSICGFLKKLKTNF